ncbi:Stf0 family sulfotransferase [Tropicibacter sp. S64]|uniref:Stf0 family sulfotransferase n=1 Tax=Tropicibacter sp. S64 TaxID=3415122 RepID=UPI003C7E636C
MIGASGRLEQDGSCYLILTTPRTGSYLLCDLLRQSGVAGRPDEYFAPEHQARVTGGLAVSTRTYLEELRQASWERFGGVFAAKVMWRQLQSYLLPALRDRSEPSNQSGLTAAFPNLKVIHLRRRDTARQALSYARAIQTGTWVQTTATAADCQGPTPQDMELTRQLERAIKADNRAIDGFLKHCDVPVLDLAYEDLAHDPSRTLQTCLTFLGLGPAVPPGLKPRLIKQSAPVRDAWFEAYRTFTQGEPA